jgi:hypothetical protein
MAKKKTTKKRGYVREQAAPAKKVPNAPRDSCLHRTAPYEDEAAALDAIDLNTFNVIEVDRRLSLLSRFAVEAFLRDPRATRKDKADIGLRAINTLEGSKVRSELWLKETEGPIPIDVETYEAELIKVEQEIKELAAHKKQKEAAEKALDTMEGDLN